MGPSKQEIEFLIHGSQDDPTDSLKPSSDSCQINDMLESLSNMGLNDPDQSQANEREKQLATMVKNMADRCTHLLEHRNRIASQLHTNRITALSLISSLKTSHAHALANEQTLRDRTQAELDGTKAQAKMLRTLLNRAESRGYDEPRLPLVWPSNSSRISTSKSDDSISKTLDANAALIQSSSSSSSTQQLDGPFESSSSSRSTLHTQPSATPLGQSIQSNKKDLDSLSSLHTEPIRRESTTGLGITSVGLVEAEFQQESPMSAIIREKNKLAADKRYLKARVRDTESQVHRLETELKALRPYLVAGGVKLADESLLPLVSSQQGSSASTKDSADMHSLAPITPSRSGSRKDKSRKKRNVTMGDAETEHLMLAARRLREIRQEKALAAAAIASTIAANVAVATATPPAAVEEPSSTSADNRLPSEPAEPTPSVFTPQTDSERNTSHTSPVKRQASQGPMLSETESSSHVSSGTPLTRTDERPPKTPKADAEVQLAHQIVTSSRQLDSQQYDDSHSDWSAQHKRYESSVSAASLTGIDELLQAAETLNPGAASSPTIRSHASTTHGYSSAYGPEASGHYHSREPSARAYPPYPTAAAALPPLHLGHPRGPADYDAYGHSSYMAGSSPIRLTHESPKRRRVSSVAYEFEPLSSPFSNDRLPRGRTSTEGAEPYGHTSLRRYRDSPGTTPSLLESQALSALDLLADQAAASQNTTLGKDRLGGGHGGASPIGSLSSDDESTSVQRGSVAKCSKSNLRQSSPNLPQSPSTTTPKANGHGNGQSNARPTEGGRSFGGNQNPEKRLPYVRWTPEEDTKLRAAIKEHGQRWELISRAVRTRSYHQCRQRYLLMRRKEAAAKAQAEAEEVVNTASASASDQQSQEENDFASGPPPTASVSRRTNHSKRDPSSVGEGQSTQDEHYGDQDISDDGFDSAVASSTPLYTLSLGTASPVGGNASGVDSFSPTARQGPFGSGKSQTPTPVGALNGIGISPYTHHSSSSTTTPSSRRNYYPPSPLSHSPRQLPSLAQPASAYDSLSVLPNFSPLTHHRQFTETRTTSRSKPTSSPTTPTNSTATASRRMGPALYS